MLANMTSERQLFFVNTTPEEKAPISLPTGTASALINVGNDLIAIDSSQSWFWTEEWQAGEREVDAHIAAGEIEEFDSIDDMFDALNT